ncbi:hypothetical protein [Micromonospora deserti]|nr:hypothetical protein [Micromonospora deserti]
MTSLIAARAWLGIGGARLLHGAARSDSAPPSMNTPSMGTPA